MNFVNTGIEVLRLRLLDIWWSSTKDFNVYKQSCQIYGLDMSAWAFVGSPAVIQIVALFAGGISEGMFLYCN